MGTKASSGYSSLRHRRLTQMADPQPLRIKISPLVWSSTRQYSRGWRPDRAISMVRSSLFFSSKFTRGSASTSAMVTLSRRARGWSFATASMSRSSSRSSHSSQSSASK